MGQGRVEDVYQALKNKAVQFSIRPGDRLNEGALARELGTSRTPLREALNRLVAEQLMEFRAGEGFFCRGLEAQTIFDLYEMRSVIECGALRLACKRVEDSALQAVHDRHYATDETTAGQTLGEAVALDEAFHMDLAALAGNQSMLASLRSINERIRFIRWLDMSTRVRTTKAEHRAVLDALLVRNARRATRLLGGHIERRMDQIVDAVKEGYSQIYMSEPGTLQERPVEDGLAK